MCHLEGIDWTCGDYQVVRRITTCSDPRPLNWGCVTDQTNYHVNHPCPQCQRSRKQYTKFHERGFRVPVYYKGANRWYSRADYNEDEDEDDDDIELVDAKEVVVDGKVMAALKVSMPEDEGYDTEFPALERKAKKGMQVSEREKATKSKTEGNNVEAKEKITESKTAEEKEKPNSNEERMFAERAWWRGTGEAGPSPVESATMDIDELEDLYYDSDSKDESDQAQ